MAQPKQNRRRKWQKVVTNHRTKLEVKIMMMGGTKAYPRGDKEHEPKGNSKGSRGNKNTSRNLGKEWKEYGAVEKDEVRVTHMDKAAKVNLSDSCRHKT